MYGLLNGRLRGLLDQPGLQQWTPGWQRNAQLRAVNAPMQPTAYQMPAMASAWQNMSQQAASDRGLEQRQNAWQASQPIQGVEQMLWQQRQSAVPELPAWQSTPMVPAMDVMNNVVTQSQPATYDWQRFNSGAVAQPAPAAQQWSQQNDPQPTPMLGERQSFQQWQLPGTPATQFAPSPWNMQFRTPEAAQQQTAFSDAQAASYNDQNYFSGGLGGWRFGA